MTTIRIAAAGLAAYLVLGVATGRADESINAKILNFSEMNRWVRVTDMICGTVLFMDRLEAQAKLPVTLCTDDSGKGKVQLYIRTGCTKNKTLVQDGIEDGETVQF